MKKNLWVTGILLGLVLIFLVLIIFKSENSSFSGEIIALKYPAHIPLEEMDRAIISKELGEPNQREANEMIDPKYLLKLIDKNGTRHFLFTKPDSLIDIENRVSFEIPPDKADVIEDYLKDIREASPFGLLMSWDQVERVFPRMTKGRLRDLETGLSFNIQRRAGSLHADVQPLTSQDTMVFKEIYQGRWSWKRRAVILEVGDYKLAASMNGMPHGQGAIYGNNFPGHFCLHFYNTQTHSGNLDTAHQLMVFKAAGEIEGFLRTKSAPEIIEIALTALRENDLQLVILTYVLNQDLTEVIEYMKKIATLKIHSIQEIEINQKYLAVIEWYELGSAVSYKEEIELELEKENGYFLVMANQLTEKMLNKSK